jgi:hypothetical protein
VTHPGGDEPFDSVRVQDNFDVQRQAFSERPSRNTSKYPHRSKSSGAFVEG